MKPSGNDRIHRMLASSARKNKVAHAYLFTGIEGIGKKLHAIDLAKTLNCESQNDRPCYNCASCQKIDKNTHPDVKLVATDKKFIKIDAIKDVLAFSQSKPFEGKCKVVIIDDAHKMNQFASNALLKTLEEPSPHSVLVLITSTPRSLLSTILSRCVKVNFSPLDNRALEKLLHAQGFTGDRIESIIHLSDGSAKQALSFLDEEIFDEIVHIREFIEHLSKKRFFEITAFAERVCQRGAEELFFTILSRQKAACITDSVRKGMHSLIVNDIDAYEKTVNMQRFLRYNISKPFLIEVLLLTLQHSEEL